jgi:hypothetical protein
VQHFNADLIKRKGNHIDIMVLVYQNTIMLPVHLFSVSLYTSLKRRSILTGGGGGDSGPRASCQYLNISKSDLEDAASPDKHHTTSTPFSSPVKDSNCNTAYSINNNNTMQSSGPSSYPQSPRDAAAPFGRETATYSSFRDSPVQRDVRRQLKFPESSSCSSAASRTGTEDGTASRTGLGSKGGQTLIIYFLMDIGLINSCVL